MLRSCYATQMRFFPDRPDVLTPVEWFWADADAPWLPFPNTFTSRNWANKLEPWPVLGEVQGAPRPWRSGKTRRFELNRSPCGEPGWFVDGVPFAARAVAGSMHFDGSLVCCEGHLNPEGAVIFGNALIERT